MVLYICHRNIKRKPFNWRKASIFEDIHASVDLVLILPMGCTENCNSPTKKLFQQHMTWASGTNTSFLYHPLSYVRLTLGGTSFSEIMVKVWCSECTGWSWELLANHVTSSRADFHPPYMSSGHQKIHLGEMRERRTFHLKHSVEQPRGVTWYAATSGHWFVIYC